MRILLTNDDGIRAAGLLALAERLSVEHEVMVSAPDSERSGFAHAFTYTVPLRANKYVMRELPNLPAYSVSGTPVDCVKLAVGNLFTDIDFVVSGINIGANLGSDVRYSGTVSAAMEAALLGYPAIAVSLNEFRDPKNLDAAAEIVARLIKEYSCGNIAFEAVLNVNVPDIPLSSIRGIKATGLSRQEYVNKYIVGADPHSRAYYWLPSERITSIMEDEDTDERWIREGYATVTPLTLDMSSRSELETLKSARLSLSEAKHE